MSMTVRECEQHHEDQTENAKLLERARRAEARCAELEDALERSRAFAGAMLHATRDPACMMEADGTILAANRGFEEALNMPRGCAAGCNAFDASQALFSGGRKEMCARALETQTPLTCECEEGGSRLEFGVYPLVLEGRPGMVVALRDVSAQWGTTEQFQVALQRTEEDIRRRTGELEHSRQLLEKVFQSMKEAVLVVDHKTGRIQDCNPAAGSVFGYTRDELLGMSMDDLYLDAGDGPEVPIQQPPGGQFCSIPEMKERHMRGKNGVVITAEHSVAPLFDARRRQVACVSVIRDVSKRRRLQAEAMRAGHLASVGELAAGVAHEINNPITGIINYGQILLDKLEEAGNTSDQLIPKRIIAEGERIAAIVRNLLFFARSNKQERAPLDVADILRDALDLTGKLMEKDGVLVSTDMEDDLPLCYGRSRELQQVFLNLLSNARDGLNRKFAHGDPGKVLELSVFAGETDGAGKVFVRFKDYGVGIPESILNRICEPFFSTKPEGEGTGLGLSISYGILREHEGKLHFNSLEGAFTAVTVELPVWEREL